MRTDQKTYLQSLSNDPDKRTKEHETIVQYLCGKEQLEKLAALFGFSAKEIPMPKVSNPLYKFFYRNGNRQDYIVGFMDIYIKYSDSNHLIIEVKSKAGPISNWIQQINSYFQTLCGERGLRRNQQRG